MNFKIDRIATQYERDWSPKSRSFESHLNQVSADEQRELIKLLVEIDIEQAMAIGIPVCAADYQDYGHEYASHAASFIESSGPSGISESYVAVEHLAKLRKSVESAPSDIEKPLERAHPDRIGNYRILNLLAVHGQGAVYRADHPHLNRQVVIKVSKNQLDEINQRAVLEEGRALATLSHPNLAQVYDLQFQDNCPYLVMEYIEGRNLAERIRDALLPPEEAADLIATLADAIQHAHDLGIVHQDLKPANIVIRAADNTPKIIDFGLASTRTAYDGDDSLNTSYGGTIAYMAPEQAQQSLSGQTTKVVDERIDIFALGAILYQLINGRRLYSFDNPTDGLQQAAKCDFDASFPAEIPADLKNICLKALACEPSERWRTASDLADALRAFTAPKSFALRPPVFVVAALGGLLLCLAVWFAFLGSPQTNTENKTAPSLDAIKSDPDGNADTEILQASLLEPLPGATFTHCISINDKGKLFTKGPVREGHHLKIEVQFEKPSYCFLFAINPDGAVQLCYPYPSPETYDESLDEVQAESIRDLNYPVIEDEGFTFADGVGQQTFILVRSSEPLPSFKEWSASAGNLADVLKARGRWIFTDGTVRPKSSKTRSAPTKIRGFASFENVMKSIQNSNPDCNVFGLSFPVEPK